MLGEIFYEIYAILQLLFMRENILEDMFAKLSSIKLLVLMCTLIGHLRDLRLHSRHVIVQLGK